MRISYQHANIKRVATAEEGRGLEGCGRRKGRGMIGMLGLIKVGSVVKDVKKRAWLPQGISGNV